MPREKPQLQLHRIQMIDTNSSNIRCYGHLQGVVGDIIPFKESTWSTQLRCVGIWNDLVGNQAEIARCFVKDHGNDSYLDEMAKPEDGGYHRTCYNYFTDSSKQVRPVKKKQKEGMSCKGTWYLAMYITVNYCLLKMLSMYFILYIIVIVINLGLSLYYTLLFDL